MRLVACLLCMFLGIAGAYGASPPPLALYGALPTTEDLELSPSGTLVATVITARNERILVIRKIGGEMVYSIKVGSLKLDGLEWVSDAYVIVYTRRTMRLRTDLEEDEYLQGTIINLAARKSRPLLRDNGAHLPYVFGEYGFAEEDGVWHGYFGVIPLGGSPGGGSFVKQGYPDLYKINLETGQTTVVAGGTSKDRRWVLDTAGRIVAYSEYDRTTRVWQVYTPDHAVAASGTSDYAFALAGFGRTPGTVLVWRGGADDRLTEIKLDGTGQEDILPTYARLIHAPNNGPLLGAIIYGETDSIVTYNDLLGRRLGDIAKAFGSAQLTLNSVSADLNRVVVFVEGNSIPGTWQLVDFAAGKTAPLAEKYPQITAEMMGPVSVFPYTAGDGLALSGILTLPTGSTEKNLPLVVLPHGGPEAVDRLGFAWWAQAFASRGYAVFQPNFRGSAGRGIAFRNAGFGQFGRKMQTDISDGVDALAAAGIIDPERVCIAGASYGGYAALAGVTMQKGRYRCAASYGGVSDPAEMLRSLARTQGRSYRTPGMRYLKAYLGVSSASDVPDEITPLARAREADAPILLIHGSDDTVVEPAQSARMASALRRADKPVAYIALKSEDHWLSRSETRLQMLTAMIAFVQKHNPAGMRISAP